jgi:hypothetical protein
MLAIKRGIMHIKKLIALCLAIVFIAGCGKESKMKKVKINIDVIKTIGEIPKDVAGIMTDPPRPQWLQDHLLSLGLAGDREAVKMHAGGANHFWFPVLKPTFTNLGWGGDTWILYDTWPAEGEYKWDELDAWIESHKERGTHEISLVFSAVPKWLWSSEDADEPSGAAINFFPYLKKGHVLPPSDYEKYSEMIYQTVRHLNVEKKYGIKFTVWNEPNVKFWQGTQQQLLELSEHSARAIKRADPESMVGGPATANLAPDWIEAFVQHFADNDLSLDFISWHYYLFYAKKYGHVQSFKEQIESVNEIIQKHPEVGNPRLYITEWAYDWKESDVSPAFNGAFVAQSLYEMIEGEIKGATYCGNLGTLESPDPAAHAFMLFNKLEDNRLGAVFGREKSSISILASGSSDRITLMVWDFPGYDEPDDPRRNSITIALESLAPGAYQYRRFLVDSEHLGMKTPHIIEDKEINSDGRLSLDFELQPYAITLIELDGSGGR